MLRYTGDDLARLAGSAWAFLAERQQGEPKIRFETVQTAASGERKPFGVIEILNDDMPFLVDSVLAELNDRGLRPYLVTHPVFGVARDANGKLTSLIEWFYFDALEPVGADVFRYPDAGLYADIRPPGCT